MGDGSGHTMSAKWRRSSQLSGVVAFLAAAAIYWSFSRPPTPSAAPFDEDITHCDALQSNCETHADLGTINLPWPLTIDEGDEGVSWRDDGPDPRLLPAFWLSSIQNIDIPQSDEMIVMNHSLPFSWDVLLGLSRNLLACAEEATEDVAYTHLPDCPPGFPKYAVHSVRKDVSEGQHRCYSSNFLFHQQLVPEKVLFLHLAQTALLFPLESESCYDLSFMAMEHPLVLQKHIQKFQMSGKRETNIFEESVPGNQQKNWCLPQKSSSEQATTKSSSESVAETQTTQAEESTEYKYFGEAQLTGPGGSHFDWRFFRKSTFCDYERKALLSRLTRAWLRFSNTLNLQTWLAHGSLLGWYWNGLHMPWDGDVDVQISVQSMAVLARYNQTLVVDFTDSATSFYVDVSPFYNNRRSDGQNVIDARFVDVTSGMYVDVTAMSVTETTDFAALNRVVDPEYDAVMKSAADSGFVEGYHLQLQKKANATMSRHHLFSCKNGHYARLDELFPLAKTRFEGELAFVPQKFEEILQREYPNGLRSHFGDWVFRPSLGLWVKIGNEQADRESLCERDLTQGMRLKRRAWFDGIQKGARPDPFLVRRNKRLHKRSPRH